MSTTLAPPSLIVTNETELNAAIAAINAGQYSGPITLTLAAQSGTIALGSALDALDVPAGTTLTIDGGGDKIDGGGQWQGLVVTGGTVTVENLTIADATALGANGTNGAGGDAGLGGGLFVGAAADVTLANVIFFKDSAEGGAGGFVTGPLPVNGASGGFGQGSGAGSSTSGIAGFGGGGGAGTFSFHGAGGGTGTTTEGGGGLGAGGDVFVEQGGQLTIQGGFSARLSGGSVTGGNGPQTAHGDGSAAGAGIYLQNELVLDPQPGDNLSIRDAITDGAGSGIDTDSEGVLIEGGGMVSFAADNTYTGSTTLDGSTLLLGLAGTAGSGEIVFQGAPSTLEVSAAAGPANTLSGFTLGDTVELLNVNVLETTATLAADDTLTLAPGVVLRFDSTVGPAGTLFDISPDSGAGIFITLDANSGNMPCFVAGTRLLAELPTGRAEIPVEALREGLLLAARGGRAAPVRWIGRRRIATATHPDPDLVHPVRIRAHAFAPGAPHTDLLLSPDHAVLVDGTLVPIRRLINGASIAQEKHAEVTYYHVELDRHDVLYAEGLATESYLDTGNRAVFENAPGPLVLHPDLSTGRGAASQGSDAACAPAMAPEAVPALWERLAERAEALGMMCATLATTRNPELRVVADGRTLAPISRAGGKHAFVLPRGARSLRLVSRVARPSDECPWLDDRRRLGVKVGRIAYRGPSGEADIALDDPRLEDGWYAVEEACRRWTDGDAALPDPRGATLLEIEVTATLAYTVDLEPTPDELESEAAKLAA
jgi:hypothetical protein